MVAIKSVFSTGFSHCHQFCSAIATEVEKQDQKIEQWTNKHLTAKASYVALRILHALPYAALWLALDFAPLPLFGAAAGGAIALTIAKPEIFTKKRLVNIMTGSAISNIALAALAVSAALLSVNYPIYLAVAAIHLTFAFATLLIVDLKEKELNKKT